MAENIRREGERKRTPEEIAEGTLMAGFASDPLTPEEIERVFRNLKNEGVNPDVGQVVRKVLKRMVAVHSADREAVSLIAFCKLHNIPYEDDYSAEELERMGRFYNYGVEAWMDLLSGK
ncbi:MAG: hypothetical protein WC348_00295 [Patescibacteria group bacterium]|jgi:hypothetical protein